MIKTLWGNLFPYITKDGDIFVITGTNVLICRGYDTPLRSLEQSRFPGFYKPFYKLSKPGNCWILIHPYRPASEAVKSYSDALDMCHSDHFRRYRVQFYILRRVYRGVE